MADLSYWPSPLPWRAIKFDITQAKIDLGHVAIDPFQMFFFSVTCGLDLSCSSASFWTFTAKTKHKSTRGLFNEEQNILRTFHTDRRELISWKTFDVESSKHISFFREEVQLSAFCMSQNWTLLWRCLKVIHLKEVPPLIWERSLVWSRHIAKADTFRKQTSLRSRHWSRKQSFLESGHLWKVETCLKKELSKGKDLS